MPTEKPVTGSDLEALKYKLGLNKNEMQHLLKISNVLWNAITKYPERPISDIAIVLLIRYFDQYPDDPLVPKKQNAKALYEKLNTQTTKGMTLKEFAVLHGREGSTGYRLSKLDGDPSPQLGQLMSIVDRRFDEFGEKGLDIFRDLANTEALARNKPNVWKTGKWGDDAPQTRIGRPRKKV